MAIGGRMPPGVIDWSPSPTIRTHPALGESSQTARSSALLHFGVEPYLLASSMLVVVAQRLVRLVCPECMEEFEPDPAMVKELSLIGLTPADLEGGRLVRGAGCANCFQTGYADRTGIYEILPIDDNIKIQIMERASATDIKKSAVQRGVLTTLRQDGASKVLARKTTVEEVVRVTQLDVF